MKTFKQHLNESLNSSYPTSTIQNNHHTYEFSFNDRDGNYYLVELMRHERSDGSHTVMIDFRTRVKGRNTFTMYQTNTSTGAARVYGTIAKELRSYLKEYPSDRISFSAADERMADLYIRFGKRIASELNGTIIKASRDVGVYIQL